MKLNLYLIHDTISGLHDIVLTAPNDEDIKRTIKSILASGQKNPITTNYEDKSLEYVGYFDNSTGVMVAELSPVHIVHFSELYEEVLHAFARRNEQAAALGLPTEKAPEYGKDEK